MRRGNGLRRRGDAKDLHRLGDILELALAQILEHKLRRVGDEIAHRARDEDRARLGDVLEPRRDVDAVAKNVVVLHHHVAEIDADAKFDPLAFGDVGVACGHAVLHVDGAAHRFDRACELGEHAVAHGFDEPPLVLGDFWLDQLAPVGGELHQRALLVGADEPRVTCDVRCENGGEPTLHGGFCSVRARRVGWRWDAGGDLYRGSAANRHGVSATSALSVKRTALAQSSVIAGP